MSDKTEAPTPHRLKRARKDGDIAKSAHLTVAVSGIVWWLFLVIEAPSIYQVGAQLLQATTQIDQTLPFDERVAGMTQALVALLMTALATLGVGVIAGIAPEAAQTRGLISFKRAAPDLKRLNPVSGLKQLFGLKTVFETVITLVQFAILLSIAWYAFRTWCAQLLPSFALSWDGQIAANGLLLERLLAAVSLSLLVPAAADYGLQRLQWRRRLRMDKNEIRREYRDEEGDPLVKGRRRHLHRELSR